MRNDSWVPSRDVRNYADGQLTVTITLAEYRELVAFRARAEERDSLRVREDGRADERG